MNKDVINIEIIFNIYLIGKQPEVPSLKQKIMFWKTYRGYVKNEINRMRQVSTNAFKRLFMKGEFILFIDFKCLLCKNNISYCFLYVRVYP